LNLVVNARDAMPEGGRLTIATRNLPDGAQLPAGLPSGEYVSVAVTDTGEGMSPEVLARALEPFFTTKEIGKGTGLGLSMVYSTMRQMGGDIEIDSRPGEGAAVRLILPVAAPPRPDAAIKPEAAPAVGLPKAGPSAILYVEDDVLVSLATRDLLEEAGYVIHTAPDAMRALHVLDDHPEIDLLVTDIGLPGVDGHELAAQARHRRPDLKVLFLSGYDRSQLVGAPADSRTEHLGKPYAEASLFEALGRLHSAGDSGAGPRGR